MEQGGAVGRHALSQEDGRHAGGAERLVDLDDVPDGPAGPVDGGEYDRLEPPGAGVGQEAVQGGPVLLACLPCRFPN